MTIATYLRELNALLEVRLGHRRRILREVEEHLGEAIADMTARGMDSAVAERLSIERFGPPATVAARFPREPGSRLPARIFSAKHRLDQWRARRPVAGALATPWLVVVAAAGVMPVALWPGHRPPIAIFVVPAVLPWLAFDVAHALFVRRRPEDSLSGRRRALDLEDPWFSFLARNGAMLTLVVAFAASGVMTSDRVSVAVALCVGCGLLSDAFKVRRRTRVAESATATPGDRGRVLRFLWSIAPMVSTVLPVGLMVVAIPAVWPMLVAQCGLMAAFAAGSRSPLLCRTAARWQRERPFALAATLCGALGLIYTAGAATAGGARTALYVAPMWVAMALSFGFLLRRGSEATLDSEIAGGHIETNTG